MSVDLFESIEGIFAQAHLMGFESLLTSSANYLVEADGLTQPQNGAIQVLRLMNANKDSVAILERLFRYANINGASSLAINTKVSLTSEVQPNALCGTVDVCFYNDANKEIPVANLTFKVILTKREFVTHHGVLAHDTNPWILTEVSVVASEIAEIDPLAF